MKIETQTKLKFYGVDFVRVDFKILKNLQEKNAPVDIDIETKVFYPKDHKNLFQIVMEIAILSEDYFNLELTAVGNFELFIESEEEDIRKNLVDVNAPAIMFPYIRAFISTFTANLGNNVVGNLIIPTKFFRGELKELVIEDE